MNGRNRSYAQALPAQPGFNVLEVIHGRDASSAEVRRLPVVACALGECPHVPYLPYPITLEGVKDGDPIELPDGRVETAFEAWDNAGQWLTDQLAQVAAARPGEAAKPAAQRGDGLDKRPVPAAEACQ
jgi:hypothetical protein